MSFSIGDESTDVNSGRCSAIKSKSSSAIQKLNSKNRSISTSNGCPSGFRFKLSLGVCKFGTFMFCRRKIEGWAFPARKDRIFAIAVSYPRTAQDQLLFASNKNRFYRADVVAQFSFYLYSRRPRLQFSLENRNSEIHTVYLNQNFLQHVIRVASNDTGKLLADFCFPFTGLFDW